MIFKLRHSKETFYFKAKLGYDKIKTVFADENGKVVHLKHFTLTELVLP